MPLVVIDIDNSNEDESILHIKLLSPFYLTYRFISDLKEHKIFEIKF